MKSQIRCACLKWFCNYIEMILCENFIFCREPLDKCDELAYNCIQAELNQIGYNFWGAILNICIVLRTMQLCDENLKNNCQILQITICGKIQFLWWLSLSEVPCKQDMYAMHDFLIHIRNKFIGNRLLIIFLFWLTACISWVK